MRTNSEIIEYMKELLDRRGMSRNQLAEKVGAASSTVSRYFTLNRQFPLNNANEYAKALGTTAEDLIGVIPSGENITDSSHNYTFLPAHIAAGALTSVDPLTYEDAEQIQLSDAMMGKYAGDRDITIMYANGDSMNRVIPSGSLLAIKINDGDAIDNGDIVVFSEDGDYSVKRYYDNKSAKIVTFSPDSTNNQFEPIVYRYEDMDNVRVVGKVVVYTVVL